VHISSRLGIQNNPIEKPDIRKQIYPCQNITYFLAEAEETIYYYAPLEIVQAEGKPLRQMTKLFIYRSLGFKDNQLISCTFLIRAAKALNGFPHIPFKLLQRTCLEDV
jgi:hypothetical protein